MRHEHRLTVQTWQCDANGHVNNAVYLNYLESARVAFLRAAGTSYRQMRERGVSLVVVRICIDFRGEARMEDSLVVVTEPVRRRLVGGTFRQAVYREDADKRTLIAEAEVSWACIDSNKRPAKIPDFVDAAALEPSETARD
ncbi:MAG TPA: thioesterase family protein [Spirochaetia bacterium]|nr:thioesterase family protein [Spirochaetia bacterium]